MGNGFEIGDKVSWTAVNGQKNGEVKELDEDNIIIQLDNGCFIIADFRSLTKIDGEHRGTGI